MADDDGSDVEETSMTCYVFVLLHTSTGKVIIVIYLEIFHPSGLLN